MKNKCLFVFSLLLFSFLFCHQPLNAEPNTSQFEADGEVVTAFPVLSRVSIKHGAIKGFSPDEETDFTVASTEMLKQISRGDKVHFVFSVKNGEALIETLTKTGHQDPVDDGIPLGKSIQGVLEATGGVAKTVSKPIPAANDVVTGTMDATTGASGAVLDNATTPVTREF